MTAVNVEGVVEDIVVDNTLVPVDVVVIAGTLLVNDVVEKVDSVVRTAVVVILDKIGSVVVADSLLGVMVAVSYAAKLKYYTAALNIM